MSLKEDRELFNTEVAPQLAEQVRPRVTSRWTGHRSLTKSARFAYFADEQRLVIIAGDQEKGAVEHAFAYGLGYREHRQLVLVLPRNYSFATLQRAPWFMDRARPEIWLHDSRSAQREPLPSKAGTIGELSKRLKDGQSPSKELVDAATPGHLGTRSAAVHDLVEWATKHPQLDPSHRRSVRAWQCVGQRVLSIKRTGAGLCITAGIHYSKPAPEPVTVDKHGNLSRDQVEVQRQVEEGIRTRLEGPKPIHRRDEHWLQAVIRRDPTLVGVEQPALRELPAWRPRDNQTRWGRGFIDLIGVDGHGDVRIVETKLSDNPDDMLILQGLDYYIWAQAYRQVLIDRLGASAKAATEIHYVIGDTKDGAVKLSPFTAAQVQGLSDDVAWRFQTVHDWYRAPGEPRRGQSTLLGPRTLP